MKPIDTSRWREVHKPQPSDISHVTLHDGWAAAQRPGILETCCTSSILPKAISISISIVSMMGLLSSSVLAQGVHRHQTPPQPMRAQGRWAVGASMPGNSLLSTWGPGVPGTRCAILPQHGETLLCSRVPFRASSVTARAAARRSGRGARGGGPGCWRRSCRWRLPPGRRCRAWWNPRTCTALVPASAAPGRFPPWR